MYAALEQWLDGSFAQLRRTRAIGPLSLPNPSATGAPLSVGLVDPTAVVVVLAYTVITGRDATGAYIGLVGQDANSLWRGLTGFFVAWCHACDPEGVESMASLRARLEARDVTMEWPTELPAALHPRDGWFGPTETGQRRLQRGGLVNRDPELAAFWEPYNPSSSAGPALVSIGPAAADLGNVVLLEDVERQSTRIEQLVGGSVAGWRQRLGTRHRLEELAAITTGSTRVERTARDAGRLPASWGSYADPVSGTWVGPVRNLKASARLLPRTREGLPVRYLAPATATRLRDIEALTV